MKLHPLLRSLLWPLGVLYGTGAALRTWLYREGLLRQERLPQIVVSVGNLTVGGTGKTPMVLLLAQRLLAEGKRVAVLSRGYKASASRAEGARGQLSDEINLLLSRTEHKVPICVGADRYREAMKMQKEGIDWFLLDDGFQHLRLARDADIVLVDAMNPFGEGILPAGPRREPFSALARADVLVITRSQSAPDLEERLRRYSHAPIFYAQTELEGIFPVPSLAGVAGPLSAPGDSKFFSFCGIGNPEAFASDLKGRWGFRVVGAKVFRDHHAYITSELREVEREAQAAGAEALVSTEKDIYNLPAEGFRMPAYFCRIGLRISEPQRFWQTILESVDRRRRGAR